jgi:ABC-type polysaccharide/polyol phosphate export permease
MRLESLLGHFRELYRYRVLIECLVRRELKARYRSSVLGYIWTLLNPILLLAVYWLVFTRYTRAVEMENYAIFFFSGILPWLWFSASLVAGSTSIAQGGALIARVCMPPQVLPAVVVLSNLVNFLCALPLAVGAAALAGIVPSPAMIFLPVAVAIELVFLYAVATALAALTVRFRDVSFLVQNLVMIWFFLTPIAYPLRELPERYRWLVAANPATPIILPFQQIVFFREVPEVQTFALGAAWALVALVAGALVFESQRDTLAEEL